MEDMTAPKGCNSSSHIWARGLGALGGGFWNAPGRQRCNLVVLESWIWLGNLDLAGFDISYRLIWSLGIVGLVIIATFVDGNFVDTWIGDITGLHRLSDVG